VLSAVACSAPEAPPAAAKPVAAPRVAAPRAEAPKAEAPKAATGKPDADGKVRIAATEEGFTPAKIEAKAGVPLKLVFRRETDHTCMTGVDFPELGIKKDLPLNTDVEIEVTPKEGGTIAFQCPMGMGKSSIVTVM
jgi:plastocyanin domain-containing protein